MDLVPETASALRTLVTNQEAVSQNVDNAINQRVLALTKLLSFWPIPNEEGEDAPRGTLTALAAIGQVAHHDAQDLGKLYIICTGLGEVALLTYLLVCLMCDLIKLISFVF